MSMISFRCDYEEGACPEVLEALVKTNRVSTPGYGDDAYTGAAVEAIRRKAACPGAEVYFVMGGTPANAMVIAHALRPYEAAISADSGHINGHETGAVEATGHKVLTRPNVNGKLTPEAVREVAAEYIDEHVVKPALVYISQPTELGTLYTLAELKALRAVCDEYGLLLYCDGARLASALTAQDNDAELPDLAQLCDAFYIGGTKCGALFGEAVVFSNAALGENFAYTRKQRGNLLAKGRLLGVQFGALMREGVYEKYGAHQNAMADKLRAGFAAKGLPMLAQTTTNQLFPVLENAQIERLSQRFAFHTWGKVDDSHTAIRLVTSWATQERDVDALLASL